ncbi:MAG: hypothetical protein ABII26_01190 [Pseudomonadota bacterium]
MKDNLKDFNSVEDKLARCRSRAKEMAQHQEKRLHWVLGIKMVILAFIVIYMAWVYISLRKVDAEFFVKTGQEKFLEALPALKTAMVARLREMAPSVTSKVGDEILNGLPQVEKNLQTMVRNALLDVSELIARDLSDWLSSFIHATKADMDRMYPDSSSYEKLTRYRKHLLRNFIDGMEVIVFQLNRFLEEGGLTEKEKIQRDIIAIWYLLLQNQILDLDMKAIKLSEYKP